MAVELVDDIAPVGRPVAWRSGHTGRSDLPELARVVPVVVRLDLNVIKRELLILNYLRRVSTGRFAAKHAQ